MHAKHTHATAKPIPAASVETDTQRRKPEKFARPTLGVDEPGERWDIFVLKCQLNNCNLCFCNLHSLALHIQAMQAPEPAQLAPGVQPATQRRKPAKIESS